MPELFLYDAIDQGSAKRFIDQLNSSKGAVTVRINSGGGSVFEGLAIFNAIERRGNVAIKIDGLAASISSLIAMAGKTVEMAENALLMIHNPWSGAAGGDSEELRKMAAMLDKAKESMLGAYTKRSGKAEAEISAIMDAETWFTAQEALEFGFIDSIYTPAKMAAAIRYNGIENFNLPARIKDMTQTLDPETQAKLRELEEIKAEQRRQSEIEARFSRFSKYPGIEKLKAQCYADKSITAQEAADLLMNELGRQCEPTAGASHVTRVNPGSGLIDAGFHGRVDGGYNDHHADFRAAAIDALLIRNGVQVARPHPAAQDVLNMSAVEMARTMLSQSGGTVRRGLFGMRQETNHDVIRAAMTTSDFPLLLEGVAGKALMSGYDSEPASHRAWTNATDVSDFKQQKRVALSEAPNLEKVLESGEYTQGAMQEKGEAFALETFGKIVSLSRQAIINDDLQAFTKIPAALGRSAARLEADKVYAILTGNPAMADTKALFHEDHNNLMEAAALSITSLAAARAKMRRAKGMQGAILNVVPRFLIVPASLESTAEQLVTSLVDPTKANNTPQNNWIRGLEIAVDARLDEDSELSWYLAADYRQVDTIEVAYLQGERGAFIEEESDFNTDAFKVKCRLDFQAAAIDWLGLIKNPGAVEDGA